MNIGLQGIGVLGRVLRCREVRGQDRSVLNIDLTAQLRLLQTMRTVSIARWGAYSQYAFAAAFK